MQGIKTLFIGGNKYAKMQRGSLKNQVSTMKFVGKCIDV
jgi:hypothetical protein